MLKRNKDYFFWISDHLIIPKLKSSKLYLWQMWILEVTVLPYFSWVMTDVSKFQKTLKKSRADIL